MSTIRTGIGLISGINTAQIVDQLISLQRAPALRLQLRINGFSAIQTGLKTLEANLISITTSVQKLGLDSTFQTFKVSNSDTGQISVTANVDAVPGTYSFQAVREVTTHQALSKGFANADVQTIGTGTLRIATGGNLHRSTLLDALNGGDGIRRGVIRITDRSGNSADIGLSNVYSVDDVLDAINNNNSTISVTAGTKDGQIVLTDTSGSTAENLSVTDLNGGHAAEDLGINKSVAADVLGGDVVFQITGDFTLDQINDGNDIRLLKGAPDIRITLTDDTVIEVNLDGSASLNDVIDKINNHDDNGGKLSASLSNGRLQLTDLSGGGGTSSFTVEDINDTSVIRQRGLDAAAAGTVITGRRLAAGINSVLLRNLRGGQGIDQLGQITLTDRAGISATLDLTSAESLDEVLEAINTAEDGIGTKLQLTARINATGTGIEVIDTSGSTASNLIIADVGAGTLAAQLGISIDAAQNSVNSGSLNHQYVNQASTLENYAPDGKGIEPGSIRIIDSAGNEDVIVISTAVKTIGDVLQRINAASGVSVLAALNETGDGFVLIDEAGGVGTLRVEEVGGGTAASLRILGDGVPGGDGKTRIQSRFAAIVDVEATDTLNDIVQKINQQAGFVTASIFDDGSSFNSKRLSLTAATSGTAGRFLIDDGGLGLNFSTRIEGRDALLRSGEDAGSGFLIASGTNSFDDIVTGLDVEVLKASDTTADVTVSLDTSKIEGAVQSFVKSYNQFIDSVKGLTKFDPETEERGVLQGQGIVLRVQRRLDSLVTRQFSSVATPIRSLIDVGIRIGADGKLDFNKDRLDEALDQNLQGVADFFLTAETGFAAKAEETIDSLTDPLTGTFANEDNALQASVDSLTKRIEALDEILLARRERLFQQFLEMEQILSRLVTQQQSIFAITPLSVNRVGAGIF